MQNYADGFVFTIVLSQTDDGSWGRPSRMCRKWRMDWHSAVPSANCMDLRGIQDLLATVILLGTCGPTGVVP
jgi:hypothetical protein